MDPTMLSIFGEAARQLPPATIIVFLTLQFLAHLRWSQQLSQDLTLAILAGKLPLKP